LFYVWPLSVFHSDCNVLKLRFLFCLHLVKKWWAAATAVVVSLPCLILSGY